MRGLPGTMAAAEPGLEPEPGIGLGLRFQRSFLAARQLRSFPWPELEQALRTMSDSSLLLDILHKTVLHPLCVKYPPPTDYRRRFLQELIRQHEGIAAEPLDELYHALAAVLSQEESPRCYKSYLLPTGDPVTLSESLAMISGGTTGLVTWEAALHLAQWALGTPVLFSGRTVLELGSGTGFTGIVICKTCSPKRYIFSDCHPRVLEQLRENILLNGFTLGPQALPGSQGLGAGATHCQKPELMVVDLDWSQVPEQHLLDLHPDLIIAADVVYDPEIISALIGTFQKLSSSRAGRAPPEVYIASTIRNPDTFHLFQAELGKVGISWQIIPTSSSVFLSDVQPNVTILQLFI